MRTLLLINTLGLALLGNQILTYATQFSEKNIDTFTKHIHVEQNTVDCCSAPFCAALLVSAQWHLLLLADVVVGSSQYADEMSSRFGGNLHFHVTSID